MEKAVKLHCTIRVGVKVSDSFNPLAYRTNHMGRSPFRAQTNDAITISFPAHPSSTVVPCLPPLMIYDWTTSRAHVHSLPNALYKRVIIIESGSLSGGQLRRNLRHTD